MHTRKVLMTLFLVSVLALTAGCGGGSKKAKKGSDNSLRLRETGDVTLTYMMWGTPEEKTAVFEMLQAFQKENPKIGLRVVHVDSLNYPDKLQAMMAGGTPPDVFYVHSMRFYNYASKGLLHPLNEFIDAETNFNLGDFYPKLLQAFKFGGDLYGIPKDWTTYVLYYNMNLFDKAGLAYPDKNWTWDDLRSAAKKLTIDKNKDGKIDQYGLIVEIFADWYYPWLIQNDGGLFDKDGNWIIAKGKNLANNAEAIQFLADLMDKDKVAPGVQNTRQLGGQQTFVSGMSAMCIYGRWVQLEFKNIKNFKWNYTVLPMRKKRATTLVGVALGMSAETKHPDEAWRLIKFLTSYEGEVYTAESGVAVPSRKSVVDSDHYLKASKVIKNQPQLAKDSVDQDPFIQELPYAVMAPNVPAWSEVQLKLDEQYEDVFLGNRDAKSVTLQLDRIVNDILSAQ